jgi:hypothetical protein
VRMPKFVCACASQNVPVRAHVQACMRVRSPRFYPRAHAKFVCACACPNLYARAHAKICMRGRIPYRVCACACSLLHARAHDRPCLRDSMFQINLKNFP